MKIILGLFVLHKYSKTCSRATANDNTEDALFLVFAFFFGHNLK